MHVGVGRWLWWKGMSLVAGTHHVANVCCVGHTWVLVDARWCGSMAVVSVFKSSQVQFFYLKTRQLATATGLDRSRYLGTTTGPLKTGPNRSTTRKKPVQTSCNQFFVVKFIVPNKSNITSCKLHIWIDILILRRLVKVSSNFIKIWLRYGENRRDIHSSCI